MTRNSTLINQSHSLIPTLAITQCLQGKALKKYKQIKSNNFNPNFLKYIFLNIYLTTIFASIHTEVYKEK